jgi:hypothetical protein
MDSEQRSPGWGDSSTGGDFFTAYYQSCSSFRPQGEKFEGSNSEAGKGEGAPWVVGHRLGEREGEDGEELGGAGVLN